MRHQDADATVVTVDGIGASRSALQEVLLRVEDGDQTLPIAPFRFQICSWQLGSLEMLSGF